MNDDLTDARSDVAAGRVSAVDMIERSIALARDPANARAFVATGFDAARGAAAAADERFAEGADVGRLAGLAVSIKDLFDVSGEVTAAGSTVLAKSAPATADAAAVARLRRAGAAFIARTNMSEFAFSGVGINPHHGTPANPVTAALDAEPRVPGGSSSGGPSRSAPARRGPRSGPTRAARSEFRRRCRASSASRARRAWFPPKAPCRCRPPSTPCRP